MSYNKKASDKYYLKNREKKLEEMKECYYRNRKKRLEYRKKYSTSHKKEESEYNKKNKKEKHNKLKNIVYSHYGNKCQWSDCDCVDPDMFQIDHTNGGGRKHYKEIRTSTNLYKWLIDNNFPRLSISLCKP